LALIVIAAVCLFAWKPLFSWLGNRLVENDGPQKVQAAVVLGGDAYGVRVIKAAQLAQAGYVPYVLVDAPKSLLGHESDELIPYAVQHGFAASLFRPILLPPEINSTRAEAKFVGEYLKKNRITKILLVTSSYHTHRAAWLFRKMNPALTVIAVPAPDPDFRPDDWWTFRDGQKTFLLEWTKTIASYIGI
jgi:uncharacterized SAM-binding protein YcdF (DUF218 family)